MKRRTWVWGAVLVACVGVAAWVWYIQGSVEPLENVPPVATTTATTPSASGQGKGGTVVATLSSISGGSKFVDLILKSGVTAQLEGSGPYTIFVPINENYGQIPANLSAVEKKRLVEYHIVVGRKIDVSIQQAGDIQALSKDMLNFSVRPGDKSARVNSSVALEKFTTANGIIYLVDQVLLPPEMSQY